MHFIFVYLFGVNLTQVGDEELFEVFRIFVWAEHHSHFQIIILTVVIGHNHVNLALGVNQLQLVLCGALHRVIQLHNVWLEVVSIVVINLALVLGKHVLQVLY